MRSLSDLIAYVLAHSRAQFRPAAIALMLAVPLVVLMVATIFALSLFLERIRAMGLMLFREMYATVLGPALFGELVRGHVKVWLGYRPEEWCFSALGVGGLVAGCVFGALMALTWGRPLWLELTGWGGAMAAAYLCMGWCVRLDEKKKRTGADTPPVS